MLSAESSVAMADDVVDDEDDNEAGVDADEHVSVSDDAIKP